MTITIYEYILQTQPQVLVQLQQVGLLVERPVIEKKTRAGGDENITRADIISLMRHDYWKRVRGALRQVHSGRVIG